MLCYDSMLLGASSDVDENGCRKWGAEARGDALPPSTLSDDAGYLVQSTIRTWRAVLDDIAADLTRTAALARFPGTALDGAVGGSGGRVGFAFWKWRVGG